MKKKSKKTSSESKMMECFTPHALMHSLMGLGLGLFLAALVPGLASIILGVVLDMMR
jgi:hypothetical protein